MKTEKKQKRERSKKEEPNKIETMLIRVQSEFKQKYINFCKRNGISYAKRIRILLENDLNNNKLN